ncbi:MAG: polysaccharide deacetylase family protein, partial [Thermoanaerobaculia bacterium]
MKTVDAPIHALSVDVEDWYQGIEIPAERWPEFERRLAPAMDKLLGLLDERGVRATFFVLGVVAEEHPEVVRRIAEVGHEVATHGYSHEKLYRMTPERFRGELRRSVRRLEDLCGTRVIGHRAAYFSITESSLWALDVLAEEGILYDSSIQPVYN